MQKHFEEHVSWKDIRAQVDLGAATFYALLKEYGIPVKEYALVSEIVARDDLYQWHVVEGLTAVRIAANLRCSNSAISRLIKKYHLDPARPLINFPREIPLSKEALEQLYLEKGLSCSAIGIQYGVSVATVRRWLQDYQIPRITGRTYHAVKEKTSEQQLAQWYLIEHLTPSQIAQKLGCHHGLVERLLQSFGFTQKRLVRPARKIAIPLSKGDLEQLYLKEQLSCQTIANRLGVSKATVASWLREYNIPRRNQGKITGVGLTVRDQISKEDLSRWLTIDGITPSQIARHVGCTHGTIFRLMQLYELSYDRRSRRIQPPAKEELEQLYLGEHLSSKEIGKRFRVSQATAHSWLIECGIPLRKTRTYTRSAIAATRLGNDFSAQERVAILARDGRRCQMPGCTCAKAWLLEVHHILSVESGGSHDLENGITLCRPCHVQIKGKEREYLDIFQEKVRYR